MIDELLTSASPTSTEVTGNDLAQFGSKAQATQITAQVIPSADDGEFRVEFQVAVVGKNGGYTFTKIGVFNEDDREDEGSLASAFPVSLGARYRFVHVSGIACHVRASG